LEGPGPRLCEAWALAHARGELAQIGSHVPSNLAALAAGWARRPARIEVPRRDPELVANVSIPGKPWEGSSPSVPLLAPQRVLVSTGSAVLRYSRTGTLLSQFPQRLDGAAPPPAESTRLRAELTPLGDEVFAPLALERWLAPAREPSPGAQADPALGGYFYSLVGLERETLRVGWWDGDPGPRAAPPPLAPEPRLDAVLRAGHVIACASDGFRVYVACLSKGTELGLFVFAYRPVSRIGQDLALEPAWSAPVRVVQVEYGGAEDLAVRPEVAARLSLDGCGRLVCTTDVGIVACLSTVSGDLEWLHERFAQGNETEFRRWGPRQQPPPPPPPAAALTVPDPERPELGPLAVAFAGPELLGVRLRTGEVLWSRPRQTLEHLLPGEGTEFLAYGGSQALGLSGRSGESTHPQRRPLSIGRFEFCGLGVEVAGGYLVPVRLAQRAGGVGGGNVSLHRLAWRRLPQGGRSILFDGSHRLPLNEPANLAIDADHVVALGATRMVVVSFRQ
ncbi:MAG: hypothetical protein KDD82_01545, partial [Planctomycetes bacterium]|nr:hypothetical protein [Planctomycetota bacterium]